LKIEGRLKGPEYVGATTRLYRQAVDAAAGQGVSPSAETKRAALQTFTRGSGPGFLRGVDHQRLVEGRTCDHRGLEVGKLRGVESAKGRAVLAVTLGADLARGDGILVEGGLGGEGELGGRVWGLEVAGQDVPVAKSGAVARVWLGPDVKVGDLQASRRVFKTSDPPGDKRLHSELAQEAKKVRLDLRIAGAIGEPFMLEGRTGAGGFARITGEATIEAARTAPLDEATLREKLGGLGEGPFTLGALDVALPAGSIVPVSSLKRARRALVAALVEASATSHLTTVVSHGDLLELANPPSRKTPAPGLFVLCRNVAQARAAIESGARGVYLDFLELTGTGQALRELRAEGAFVGVAPPRIRKPGEEKIDDYVASLAPDAILVRGLGALRELTQARAKSSDKGAARPLAIGDFSLNVTNRIAVAEVLGRGLDAFTPSFDLDAAQLIELLRSPFGPWSEIVVHHPMALFHMEHCVFAALLSEGRDYKTCGRPCETRQLSLRDRAGMDHPVEADVGCRNTVFHARPQSAVQMLPELVRAGVGRFRIEVVRESPEDVRRLVTAYQRAIDAPASAPEIWRELRTEAGYGVVKGSLRVLS
ncbi:MAG: DUF3656 domain-containing protein, partial [Polyangiaceae bacterium]